MTWTFTKQKQVIQSIDDMEDMLHNYVTYHGLDRYDYDISVRYVKKIKGNNYPTEYRWHLCYLPFHHHKDHLIKMIDNKPSWMRHKLGIYLKRYKIWIPMFELVKVEDNVFHALDAYHIPWEGRRRIYEIKYYPLRVEDTPPKRKKVIADVGSFNKKGYLCQVSKLVNVKKLMEKL